MEKYERIEALYARRSELELAICTLENKIVNAPSTDRLGQLRQLRDLHYQEFMMEFEIKAVLEEPKKRSFWNIVHQI